MTLMQVYDCYSEVEIAHLPTLHCAMVDQLAAVTSVLTEARGWSVDQHVAYDGSTMILAEHDDTGQTFVLSNVNGRIDLARVHDDRMVAQGTFSRMEAALDTLLIASRA